MPSNAEIAKDTIEQFKKIQDYMILAKEENAVKTYDRLKREYLSLKALLNYRSLYYYPFRIDAEIKNVRAGSVVKMTHFRPC